MTRVWTENGQVMQLAPALPFHNLSGVLCAEGKNYELNFSGVVNLLTSFSSVLRPFYHPQWKLQKSNVFSPFWGYLMNSSL